MKEFLWWRDGVIYQIYPRSFYDTTGNGIGDLRGITEKLDYLSDLGVDAIWLSPIYPSPDRDFGYDVSDYLAIDPRFGSMANFDHLVSAAEKKGIRLILDLVLNHTSDQHPWFLASKSSRQNPKRNWYIWRDGRGKGKSPNNWLSVFGGSAWQWDEDTRQYYLHMFYKEQPDLNWRNPHVRQQLLDVFRFWLDKGVKGFRLDVFNLYFKDEQFRNNPVRHFRVRPDQRQDMRYNCDQPEMMEVLHAIRQILDGYKDSYAIGETFLGSPEKAAAYCGENALHQAFSFDFLECGWNAACFEKVIRRWESSLGKHKWPNYVLNNHDVKRSASRYGRGEDDERLKVAAAMLLTLRGTPFMYYGEEIGMREVRLKHSQILDPIGKRYWPFYKGRDGCRTPMQWDDSQNGGFSRGNPWLPLHPDAHVRNVDKQLNDPKSLLRHYKNLIALRRSEPVLVGGEMDFLDETVKNVLAYRRILNNETATIFLNFSNAEKRVALPETPMRRFYSSRRSQLSGEGMIALLPNEALIIFSQTDSPKGNV